MGAIPPTRLGARTSGPAGAPEQAQPGQRDCLAGPVTLGGKQPEQSLLRGRNSDTSLSQREALK